LKKKGRERRKEKGEEEKPGAAPSRGLFLESPPREVPSQNRPGDNNWDCPMPMKTAETRPKGNHFPVSGLDLTDKI
jgi:hypothetical protein